MIRQFKIAKNLLKYGKKGSKEAVKFVRKNPELVYDALKVVGPAVVGAFTVLKTKKNKYIEVPNVLDLDIKEAEKILEDEGFVTHSIVVIPNHKYYDKRANSVIRVMPNSKKIKEGSHINLYYIDEKVLKKSIELNEEKTTFTEKIANTFNKKEEE